MLDLAGTYLLVVAHRTRNQLARHGPRNASSRFPNDVALNVLIAV